MATRLSILAVSSLLLIVSIFIQGFYLIEDLFHLKIKEKEVFTISSGEPAFKIIQNLYQSELIRSKFLPEIIISNSSISKNLKTGRYQFNTSDNLISMFYKLYKGIHYSFQFNIIPGTNINDLRTVINNTNLNIHDKNSFELKEGIYFPSSYYYEDKLSLLQTFEKAKNIMDEKLDYYWKNRLLGLPIKSKYDLLIVASLIEKETNLEEERKKVARVIYNRLDQKIPLQFCSSIVYILKEKRPLSYSDLKIKSPYNTYRNRGLPPTPISYPGEPSLEAAAFPDDAEYLYFTLLKNGKHHFSSDFAEHKKNKFKNN
ncbi:MAG: hypothetical protein CMF41_05030 [Legionellales bacterium]|nr:hypothetical protein [Legionellales bacterium]OUX64714.1 MAG: hypothetical protein CBE41_02685 [Gammaproteobacteria bacterium TMED281]